MVAVHDLPTKLAEGRLEDIAPCTACMTCFEAVESGRFPRCRVNAALGREREYEIEPAEVKKTVVVIGGGPAGLEAARVAAMRGHEVSLYEKKIKLGGVLPIANLVKGFEREDLLALARYLETQVRKLGVDVHAGAAVDRPLIDRLAPDVVIIAAGGDHEIPALPGVDGPNVLTGAELHRDLERYMRILGPRALRELTRVWMPVGERVIIIGGQVQGCQIAELLAKRGRQVTIIERGTEFGTGIPNTLLRPYLINWLANLGVTLLKEATCTAVTDTGVVVDTRAAGRLILAADTVITALPLLPRADLLRAFEGSAPEVYAIGDAQEPGLIVDAIAAGARVARSF